MPARAAICEHAALFDVPGQAVIGTTATGEIVYWSDHAAAMFGWTAEEVMGQPVTMVTPAAASRAQAEEIMAMLRDGRAWAGPFQLRHRDGHEFVAEVRDLPVFGGDGTLIGIVGVTRGGR